MGLNLDYVEGQTTLEDEEKDGLLIPHITTRSELDEAEQRNIEEAILWLHNRRKRFTVHELLTEEFIRELHLRMFSGVCKWAGVFRKSEKNIGVRSYLIGTTLRELLQDCVYWITNSTYDCEEVAIRFKHRIVLIHCFANGNGRHSRLIADVIIEKIFMREAFTWGAENLIHAGTIRAEYLRALQMADRNDYEGLIKFSRSIG